MRATIRDPETLKSVRPLDLAAYLRATGWRQQERFKGRSVWTLGSNGESFEILLPLDDSFRDYALRISDLLRILERVEDRSQLEVVADVAMTFADVVRAVAPTERHSGTIDLDAGLDLIGHARDMMAAAACAALKPSPKYSARRPDQAQKYLSSLELGQTEHGSYVVTVLSVIPPPLDQGALFEDPLLDEPFERKVTRTLADAWTAAIQTAEEVMVSGSMSSLEEAVGHGLSANLCDALVGLHAAAGGDRLRLGLSWASARPPDRESSPQVQINRDTAEIISEAGRVLRGTEDEPEVGFELVGVVTALKWDNESKPGRVTITGPVSGDVRKVSFDLSHESYHVAVDAHDKRSTVRCIGDLIHKGRIYLLENPRSFDVLQE